MKPLLPALLVVAATGVVTGGAPPKPPATARPDNEFNVEQSAASRAMIEEYLKKTKTSIWIQHDFRANAKLKKSPAFYE